MNAKAAKKTLRKSLREARNMLPEGDREAAAVTALGFLKASPILQNCQMIGSYLAHESEFDPVAITDWATAQGLCVVYPRVVGDTLKFCQWKHTDPTETTIGGVHQPTASAAAVSTDDIDLFLTPLLACGHNGQRLGYGGGFYDRLFSTARGFRLGVGFALQYREDWPTEAHDRPLQGFLSEEGLVLFSE